VARLTKEQKKLDVRVRRIAGRVAMLEGALESAAGRGAVLHRLAARREAINDLMLQVLEGRLREHIAPAKNTGKPS
jgi:DNA-binding FrmR family transcriptional regulator